MGRPCRRRTERRRRPSLRRVTRHSGHRRGASLDRRGWRKACHCAKLASGKWTMLVDDQPGPEFSDLAPTAASFSPDSRRYCYPARTSVGGDDAPWVAGGTLGSAARAAMAPEWAEAARRIAPARSPTRSSSADAWDDRSWSSMRRGRQSMRRGRYSAVSSDGPPSSEQGSRDEKPERHDEISEDGEDGAAQALRNERKARVRCHRPIGQRQARGFEDQRHDLATARRARFLDEDPTWTVMRP